MYETRSIPPNSLSGRSRPENQRGQGQRLCGSVRRQYLGRGRVLPAPTVTVPVPWQPPRQRGSVVVPVPSSMICWRMLTAGKSESVTCAGEDAEQETVGVQGR